MVLTSAEIMQWIGMYLWPFFRISGMLMGISLISISYVPRHIRLAIAVVISFMVAPILPEGPNIALFSVGAVWVCFQQLVIGLALGFVTRLLFQVFVLGGQIIAMQMGLGFASMMDPSNGVTVTGLGQIYFIMTSLLFLIFNGHLAMIQFVVDSFKQVPIGVYSTIPKDALWKLLELMGWVYSSAVKVALPAIIALLLSNLAFGVMSRAAPQLNIFSIGFPTNLVFGLLVALLSVVIIANNFRLMFSETMLFARTFLGVP